MFAVHTPLSVHTCTYLCLNWSRKKELIKNVSTNYAKEESSWKSIVCILYFHCHVFFKRFCLFIFREGKRGRKRGKETPMCGCLSGAPYWGPGLQPRHVSWLGIEPATLWFSGRHSIHWAIPARAIVIYFKIPLLRNIFL